MMDDPEVFTKFSINTLSVTFKQTINVIKNFVECFGGSLALNYGDIDNFVKDTHSANSARAAAQIILSSNNVTQGLKPMFFEIKNREFCNDLPD